MIKLLNVFFFEMGQIFAFSFPVSHVLLSFYVAFQNRVGWIAEKSFANNLLVWIISFRCYFLNRSNDFLLCGPKRRNYIFRRNAFLDLKKLKILFLCLTKKKIQSDLLQTCYKSNIPQFSLRNQALSLNFALLIKTFSRAVVAEQSSASIKC